MPIEFGLQNTHWYADYPLAYQLWASPEKAPGDEVSLVATLGRNLTISIRDDSETIASWVESDDNFPASIASAERGLVQIAIPNETWTNLQPTKTYWIDISAYGVLRLSELLNRAAPEMSSYEVLNGVELYGSPRQIVEVLSNIPGASTNTSVALSGWSKNAQGYWTLTRPKTQELFGLWVNDRHSRRVNYAELAKTNRGHAIAESATDYTIYYNGSEDLTSFEAFVETGDNIYVWRCLKEATKEIERKAGRWFNLQRVFRDPYNGRLRQTQLVPRVSPVKLDSAFRLDAFSRGRALVRRYLQVDFNPGLTESYQRLQIDPRTGVITLTETFWDWLDAGWHVGIGEGFGLMARFPAGENNLELTCQAGYEVTPADIDEAAANLAAIRQGIFWQQLLTQGMSSIQLGCANLNFGELTSRWFPTWQFGADTAIAAHQSLVIEDF